MKKLMAWTGKCRETPEMVITLDKVKGVERWFAKDKIESFGKVGDYTTVVAISERFRSRDMLDVAQPL